MPDPRKELGKHCVKRLAKRVVIDTGTGRIIADGTVHHRSCLLYLRQDLPKEVQNIRVDYYRLPDGHRRDEDADGCQ